MTDPREFRASVLVIIVNYRSAGLAIDCLESLAPEVAGWLTARVVVTDNASGDGSVELLNATIAERGWGAWATVQSLPRNGGFAYGNNAAIRPALEGPDPPRYVWLLNPDTLVRPGALAALVAFLEDHPDVGMSGSRLEGPDGLPQRSAFRFPSVLGELDAGLRFGPVSRLVAHRVIAPPVPVSACPIDWVAGASLMVRREVFEAVGLLDEGYFMYYEEVDFCRKARRAGWPCWYVPSSRVVHLVGQVSGVTTVGKKKRSPAYWFEARSRYYLRNQGRLAKTLADLAFATGFATYRVRQKLQGKADEDPDHFLSDFVRYNFLPVAVGRREGAQP
jgi:GT2 family glycosyltransferase